MGVIALCMLPSFLAAACACALAIFQIQVQPVMLIVIAILSACTPLFLTLAPRPEEKHHQKQGQEQALQKQEQEQPIEQNQNQRQLVHKEPITTTTTTTEPTTTTTTTEPKLVVTSPTSTTQQPQHSNDDDLFKHPLLPRPSTQDTASNGGSSHNFNRVRHIKPNRAFGHNQHNLLHKSKWSDSGELCDIEETASMSSMSFSDIVSHEPNKRSDSKHVGGMVSCLELFKIGVGPSSSHTVGPMKAANVFLDELEKAQCWSSVESVRVELFGSLALTGVGHGTDTAILIGLLGEQPQFVDPSKMSEELSSICKTQSINLARKHVISFNPRSDVVMHKTESLPFHSNAMTFTALNNDNEVILQKTYYSIGGGFIVDDAVVRAGPSVSADRVITVKHSFRTMDELLTICELNNLTIAEVVLHNEEAWRPQQETLDGIKQVWQVMQDCVRRGCCSTNGKTLPGILNVSRRAPYLFAKFQEEGGRSGSLAGSEYLDRLSLFALAVSEENAAGGRVVTAPTNGAAGIIPAVLHYIYTYHSQKEEDIIKFFLTATAIGYLFKEGASISGAEAGCQGEVGVASSMAAAGLAAVLGGSNRQVENAAEIAMEHHLGMTCDPVGGLVQVPCIERNTMGAVKAVNSALLALHGHGVHVVSLDKVIRAMNSTAKDMLTKYKETSTGGLALEFEFRESVIHPQC